MASAAQFAYLVDFDGSTLDSRLTNFVAGAAYSFILGNGRIEFRKADGAGPGSGGGFVFSTFRLTGDFSVSVGAHRGPGKASAGLVVATPIDSAPIGYVQEIFFVGQTEIRADRGEDLDTVTRTEASSQVTFRTRRVGASVFSEYDTGSGYQTILTTSGAGSGAAVRVNLFLIQEGFDSYTDYASVGFDDLRIEADGVADFTPGTFDTSATIARSVQICWATTATNRYQAQWASQAESNRWLNLGGPVQGTGFTNCACDPLGSIEKRFYRIETLP